MLIAVIVVLAFCVAGFATFLLDKLAVCVFGYQKPSESWRSYILGCPVLLPAGIIIIIMECVYWVSHGKRRLL